jgi:hypothetical protein
VRLCSALGKDVSQLSSNDHEVERACAISASARAESLFYKRWSASRASAFDLLSLASSLSDPPTLIRMKESFFKT